MKLYCVFFTAHAPNGHITTSGLKPEVTVVFLERDFMFDAGISRTFNAVIGLLLIFACILRTFSPKCGVVFLEGGGRGGAMFTTTNSFLLFGILRLCQFW